MTLCKTFFFTISMLFCTALTSCHKEENLQLIDEQYKNITVSSGFDNGIKLASSNWVVEYVRDENTGNNLLDSTGQHMELTQTGEVVTEKGFLRLTKDSTGYELNIRLEENFSDSPRVLSIGMAENGKKDVIKITQRRGSKYSLVDKEVREIDSLRKIYLTDEDCLPLTLSNTDDQDKYISYAAIYQNVYYLSEFLSDEEGAFVWLPQDSTRLQMADLLVKENVVWSDFVPYVQGKSTEPFNKNSKEELLVRSHTQVDLVGAVTYCERTCTYTFTIKNEDTGFRFNISGIWKQKVPISSSMTIKQVTTSFR